MNNEYNTYLVCVPQGVESTQKINTLMEDAEFQSPVFPGVTLVRSRRPIAEWFEALHNTGPTGGALNAPIVIPVDVKMLQGTQGLPTLLSSFIQQTSTKAA